jgi:hypothetical protein
MKMAVFWDVTQRILTETDRCFRGAYCLHHKGDEFCILNYLHHACVTIRGVHETYQQIADEVKTNSLFPRYDKFIHGLSTYYFLFTKET